MLDSLIYFMGLVVFSSVMQANYKIPSPITLMAIVLAGSACGIKMITLSDYQFDTLVLITLPLLIVADSLKIKWEDLKEHGLSLFWVAVITVVVSVGMGLLVNDFILSKYALSIAEILILFCMVSATDPVTVSAVFSNFNVPHKLKVLTEGESLFNDASALIVFSIAILSLQDPSRISIEFVVGKSFMVIFGATLLGIILGYLTTVMLKLSDQPLVEATIILLSSYIAYTIGEHLHFSGILAVIVNVVMANKVIQKIIHQEDIDIENASKIHNFGLLKYAITTKDNQETIIKSIDFVAMFASAILFISIALVANFSKLYEYKYEILGVFLASTVIRALMMLKFALVSNNVKMMQSIQKHWWAVLTFAGSKGAISILMVHMLPANFRYKELFENIIVGNILLSTFIYASALAVIITKNKDKFRSECEMEIH